MKKSKTTPNHAYVPLKADMCLRQGLDQLVEVDMELFQDVHAYAVMIFELTKRFGDVVEQMREAVKKNKRRRTRHKRAS